MARLLKLTIAGTDSVAPVLPAAAGPAVEVWRDDQGGIWAYAYTVSGEHWVHLPGLATFRLGRSPNEVAAIVPPPIQAEFIHDVYRRAVLPLALQAFGLEVLHASAVLMPRGVVALCAFSGTGKSTIAYGLSRRGHPLWADDAVAFDTSGGCVRAIPLPFETRFRSDAASFFNEGPRAAKTHLGLDSDGKIEKEPAPLTALCVLKRQADSVPSTAVETRRLSAGDAFPAVLIHAYYFSLKDVKRRRRMIEQYLNAIANVPVFEIRFRAGLEKLPAILDGVEEAVNTVE